VDVANGYRVDLQGVELRMRHGVSEQAADEYLCIVLIYCVLD
jgi:hypothetical protein